MLRKTKAKKNVFFYDFTKKWSKIAPNVKFRVFQGFLAKNRAFWVIFGKKIIFGKILADNKQFGTKIIEIDQEFNFVEFFKEIGAFYQFLTRLWGTTLHKDLIFYFFFAFQVILSPNRQKRGALKIPFKWSLSICLKIKIMGFMGVK